MVSREGRGGRIVWLVSAGLVDDDGLRGVVAGVFEPVVLLQTAQRAVDLLTALVGTGEGPINVLRQSPFPFRDGLDFFGFFHGFYLFEVVLRERGVTSISVTLALRSANLSCNSSRRMVSVYASA